MGSSQSIAVEPEMLAALEVLASQKSLSAMDVAREALRRGLSVLEQEAFFARGKRHADELGVTAEDGLRILRNAGNEPPQAGDELPPGYVSRLG